MLDPKVYSFLAIVNHGSYTKAANNLHLTQPAISQHIQKLEEYYQVKLFKSSGRSVVLTQHGHNFLAYTKMQIANEHHLLNLFKNIETPLRIGATLSIAEFYLPELLNNYETPNSSINISVANTQTLLKDLLDDKLDAAFIEGNFSHPLFNSYTFKQANFIPVVNSNHPLANKNVSLSKLHDYPLIIREAGSGTRAILENYLFQQNDSINSFSRIHLINNFKLIKQFIQTTNSISFMYESVAKKELNDSTLSTININNYQVIHPLLFVYPKNALDQDKTITFFRQCLKP